MAEAGATLSEYLSSLPESLIPGEYAEQLWHGRNSEDIDVVFGRILASLVAPNRHLVLYLLNFFRQCCFHRSHTYGFYNPFWVEEELKLARKYHSTFFELDHGPDSKKHATFLLKLMINYAGQLSSYDEERQWKVYKDNRLTV